MKNFFDDDQGEENFSDQPEEMNGQYNGQGEWIPGQPPPVQIQVQKPATPPPAPAAPAQNNEPEYEEAEEDNSSILNDARLRLEQGRLFEMVMKHDIFDGVDADPRAIKSVQKLIRDYAQERMEIMLGMRQEVSKEQVNSFPLELFPFNSLEVETLKALAAAATKGASRDAEPLDLVSAEPARTSLKPIGSRKAPAPAPKKPSKPLPKAPGPIKRVSPTVQAILEEEGLTLDQINEVMNGTLTPEERQSMTPDQIAARNANIRNKRAKSTTQTPMPSPEALEQMYTQRSQMAEAQVKGWRELMGMVKALPSKPE